MAAIGGAMDQEKRQTPEDVYRGILETLNADRLDLINADYELIKNGWSLHLAIDPYDLQALCFPFAPDDIAAQMRPDKIEEMSRLQNGRYEAFYNLATRPILLEPYVEEVERLRNWILFSNFVPSPVDLVDKYLEILSIPTLSHRKELRETLSELTERDISSLLAVVTGMVSIGSERFTEILSRRLIRSEEGLGMRTSNLRGDQHSIKKIFDVLQGFFERRRGHDSGIDREKWAQRSLRMIERSNWRDAKAIYEVLWLNKQCNQRNQLVLYLSSSPKSAELFESAPLQNDWPVIPMSAGGQRRRYDLVRTASDLFVYMVARGQSDEPSDRPDRAIARLTSLKKLIGQVEEIRTAFQSASDRCEHCNFGGQAKCEFQVYCDGVIEQGKEIAAIRENNVNWSLERRLASMIEDARSSRTGAVEEKYSTLLKTLSDVLRKTDTSARAQEMQVEVALNKAYFVASVVEPRPRVHRNVSCHLNYYPMRLRANDPELRKVLEAVSDLLPRKRWDDQQFNRCVNEYLNIDASRRDDPQSELVRCFLYLVMENIERAGRVAKKFLDRPISEIILQEFRYLDCFILWRADRFVDARFSADEGIRLQHQDGRFHHIRSLVLFSESASGNEEHWKQIVISAERAANIFKRKKDPDMEAASCNNLAFFLSAPERLVVDVDSADKYLQRLTDLIPESEWDPTYPEFFHTKGCVLLAKFLTSAKSGTPDVAVLTEANTNAMQAYNLYPEKTQHYELVTTIDRKAREYSIAIE